MADGSSWLGDLGDILKGGLEAALDLEIEERRREIENPPLPRGDTTGARRADSGRLIRTGSVSDFFAASVAGVPVWVLAAGAVVGLVLLLRR